MALYRPARKSSILSLVGLAFALTAFAFLVRGAPCQQAGRSGQPPLPIEEKVIVEGRFDNLAVAGQLGLVPDGKSVVTRKRENGRWKIFINGKAVGEDADRISPPVISEDELHSAFAVARGTRTTIVVDGQERGEIEWLRPGIDYEVSPPPLVFSADGRNVASGGVSFGKQKPVRARVLGQEPGAEYDAIGPVAVSSGTPAHLAYGASRAGKHFMVLDGAETASVSEFDLELVKQAKAGAAVEAPTFSPDGSRFAYFVRRSVKVKLFDKNGREKPEGLFLLPVASVVDGKEVVEQVGTCTSLILSRFVFSPDNKRVAYAVMNLESVKRAGSGGVSGSVVGRVTVDGEQGPTYSSTGSIPYAAEIGYDPLGNSPFPLVKKTLNPSWTPVSSPVFSPDSRHVAYVARKAEREVAVVLDGAAQAVLPYETALSDPQFSPDSQHLACVCWDKGRIIVVLDGKPVSEVPAPEVNFVQALTFSPDGRRLAFAVERLGGNMTAWHRVVVDGTPQKEYESMPVKALTFSPDGRHVAYVVTWGGWSGGYRVVMDGQEGPKYPKIYPASVAFSAAGELTFLAIDKRGLLQVSWRVD